MKLSRVFTFSSELNALKSVLPLQFRNVRYFEHICTEAKYEAVLYAISVVAYVCQKIISVNSVDKSPAFEQSATLPSVTTIRTGIHFLSYFSEYVIHFVPHRTSQLKSYKIYHNYSNIFRSLRRGCHFRSYNQSRNRYDDIRQKVMSHDWAVQFHDFYLNIDIKEIRFDVVMSFDINPKEGLRILHDKIKGAYPEYNIQITPDIDISD